MKGHGMNNITEGPSLVTYLTEEGTRLPLNRGDSLDAAATQLTPLNDDAVKATDNVGLSAGIKVAKTCDSCQDIQLGITLTERRDLAGILATRDVTEGNSVPAQLQMPLNKLGQIPQPPLFQPQWSRLNARQILRKKRRKLFQSCYRPLFTKRLRSISDHGDLRWKLRRLLLFMQMSRLSRWALRLLALRAIFWNSWRQHGRRHQPAPSGAYAYARSGGAADVGLLVVLAILYFLLIQVCWDMALGHLKAQGWNIVLGCGYLASAVSEGGVSSGFFMCEDVTLSKCHGLTLLAQSLVFFLSVLTALLLAGLRVPRNLSLLSVGQCLQSSTLLRPDSPFGLVICCFATLALHLAYQIGLGLAFISYHSIGFGATVCNLFVPYITNSCWVFGSVLGRTVTLDFIVNLKGPPQGFAPLSLVTSGLYLLFLLGWSRVLCSWVLLSPSGQDCLDNAPNPTASTTVRPPLLDALATLSLSEILQGNLVRTLDEAEVCVRRLEHELLLLQQATSIGCQDTLSSDGLVAARLLQEVLCVSALQDHILITADSYPSGDALKSNVIRAVHKLTPELDRLQAHLSTIVDLHARQEDETPSALLKGDSMDPLLNPSLQALDTVAGLSMDMPHLMLTWNNGRQSMLRGLTVNSSCAEVYAKVGLDPGQCGGSFYLRCNGRRLPFSQDPLSTFLFERRGELALVGMLRGAGSDGVRARNPDTPPPRSIAPPGGGTCVSGGGSFSSCSGKTGSPVSTTTKATSPPCTQPTSELCTHL